MAFGKRAPGAWMRAPVPPRPQARHRRLRATALVGLVLGCVGLTSAATVVRASERGLFAEMFDALFGAPKSTSKPAAEAAAVEMPRKAPRRYSALPDARKIEPGRRLAQQTPRLRARAVRPPVQEATAGAAALKGTQTVCVRLCDGYAFPVGRLKDPADLPVHQAACAAACPGARTDLFTLASGESEVEKAVSLAGQPYLSASWANLYRRTRVAQCACRPAGSPLLGAAEDRTVRAGDVFATEDSADVVTALTRTGPVLTDYRDANIGEGRRRIIEARVGAIRRDTDAAAFRRVLRLAENRSQRIRTAEVQVARLRMDGAEGGYGFAPVQTASAGFAPVRVVVPSPFER